MHLLFFKENPKINKLPLEEQPLLDEFFDVVLKEIPHDLTPMSTLYLLHFGFYVS